MSNHKPTNAKKFQNNYWPQTKRNQQERKKRRDNERERKREKRSSCFRTGRVRSIGLPITWRRGELAASIDCPRRRQPARSGGTHRINTLGRFKTQHTKNERRESEAGLLGT